MVNQPKQPTNLMTWSILISPFVKKILLPLYILKNMACIHDNDNPMK